MKTRKDLADVILNMTYGELKGIAGDLAEMIEPDVRPKVETPDEFVSLLHDWADAQG